jgi:hypothetical protein
MDHKIWAGSEESHMKRNSDAAFHLYARLNLTSVWRSANGQQHLLKIEVKIFFKKKKFKSIYLIFNLAKRCSFS